MHFIYMSIEYYGTERCGLLFWCHGVNGIIVCNCCG